MYRGRFAPSPTGPLHFGSLIAAIASYLQAKKNNGKWLLRIEDIDHPRTVADADKIILDTLEHFCLYWDEEIIYQSRRQRRYAEIIDELTSLGYLYPCCCSRKAIGNKRYPGTCRNGVSNNERTSTRIRVNKSTIAFTDRVQGKFSQNLDAETGDFIIKRSDGLTAYNLAVVIDDADQKINEIVRGADLIDTTPRQIFLQQTLAFPPPSYIHFPVAVDKHGKKLGKQNHTPGVDVNNTTGLLINALDFLGQSPPPELNESGIEEIIQWGLRHWDYKNIPNTATIFWNR